MAPSSSSSLLRVMCLHDERSNSLELSRKLNALGERLYQKHGIDFVFVDAPLIVTGGEVRRSNTKPEDGAVSIQDHHPWRAWWEKETEYSSPVLKNRSLEEPGEDEDDTDSSTEPNQNTTSEPTNNETNNTPPRYVGLDASLLHLKQIWSSSPFWGILAVGQAAGVASLLPLLPSTDGRTPQPPSFMIFVHAKSLLEQDEPLTEHLNLPCLHIVDNDPIPNSTTLRLIHQFGGDVVSDRSLSPSSTSPCSSGAFNNYVGRFLVAQKKILKKNTADIAVLALRHELHRTEEGAAHLVARHIAQNPPDALMAVITPKDVGGFRDKRRGPDEEGGGAPCPSDFLLHRTKRTTTKNYQASDDDSRPTRDSEASRHHPNQQSKERWQSIHWLVKLE